MYSEFFLSVFSCKWTECGPENSDYRHFSRSESPCFCADFWLKNSKTFFGFWQCYWKSNLGNRFPPAATQNEIFSSFSEHISKKQFPWNLLSIFRNTIFLQAASTGIHYFQTTAIETLEDRFLLPFSFKSIDIFKRTRENRRNNTYSSSSFSPTHNHWYTKKQLQELLYIKRCCWKFCKLTGKHLSKSLLRLQLY